MSKSDYPERPAPGVSEGFWTRLGAKAGVISAVLAFPALAVAIIAIVVSHSDATASNTNKGPPPAQSSTDSEPSPNRYSNARYLFSVDYPHDWVQHESENGDGTTIVDPDVPAIQVTASGALTSFDTAVDLSTRRSGATRILSNIGADGISWDRERNLHERAEGRRIESLKSDGASGTTHTISQIFDAGSHTVQITASAPSEIMHGTRRHSFA